MKDISITIKGFKSEDEAIEFMSWYNRQGEQYIPDWMQNRKQEGKDVREYLNTQNIDKQNLILTLQ